ncbi:MAG: hypothetical protein MJ090_00490 [Clostridia bacterium]|nr:hypothetical protein [Clostridia bacterium]
MTEQEFIIRQQNAVERMKKMAENSNAKNEKKPKNIGAFDFPISLEGLNIPFLEKLKSDKDTALILGLVLILFCEKSDKLLLIALLYILL